MAEVTAFRNNALPYPVYGVPWAVTFPLLDADGDLVTGATTPDAEVSKNGDTFADCTNESVEIATASGVYYLLLTGAEMTADIVTVIAKSATAGMKTTVLTFYPRKLVSLRAGTSQGGAAGSITLDASANATDDYYNGCLVVGVIDTLTEARIITDYTGSSKVAAVTPNWNVTPDADDTFTIYLPEGRQINQADVVAWNGTAIPGVDTAGYPKVTIKDGTGTGELDTASGVVLAKDHTGAALATPTNITGGVITTVTNLTNLPAITSNWLTAAGIAATALNGKGDWNIGKTGYALSSAGVQAIWDALTSALTTVGSIGKLLVDNINATISSRMATTHLAATAGKLDGVALADTVTTYTGNTKQTGDVATLITTVGVAGAGLTAADDAVIAAIAALNNLSAANVATELGTYDAPTNTEMVAAFTQIKGATWATTDTLEAIRDRGDAAWITATGFATHSAADVWAVATRILTAGTNIGFPSAATIATAVWDALTSALTTLGSIGKLLVDNVDAAITSRMATYTQPTGFLAASFPTDPADASVIAGRFDTLDASVADVPTNTELATALGTADDAVLTQVALVKAQTDKMTFTVANQIDSNVQYVNDVAVTGTGAVGDTWGP